MDQTGVGEDPQEWIRDVPGLRTRVFVRTGENDSLLPLRIDLERCPPHLFFLKVIYTRKRDPPRGVTPEIHWWRKLDTHEGPCLGKMIFTCFVYK